jgi:hypothetical protein
MKLVIKITACGKQEHILNIAPPPYQPVNDQYNGKKFGKDQGVE